MLNYRSYCHKQRNVILLQIKEKYQPFPAQRCTQGKHFQLLCIMLTKSPRSRLIFFLNPTVKYPQDKTFHQHEVQMNRFQFPILVDIQILKILQGRSQVMWEKKNSSLLLIFSIFSQNLKGVTKLLHHPISSSPSHVLLMKE